jgi:hypothetical protein
LLAEISQPFFTPQAAKAAEHIFIFFNQLFFNHFYEPFDFFHGNVFFLVRVLLN